jgi:hypothetical protein
LAHWSTTSFYDASLWLWVPAFAGTSNKNVLRFTQNTPL